MRVGRKLIEEGRAETNRTDAVLVSLWYSKCRDVSREE